MKKLSTKWFKKWSKKVKLTNGDLLKVIDDLDDGASTTDLGSHLFKVRVSREHCGKSSGFRTIIIYQENEKAIFLYGFGKNEKQNISKAELQYFKKLGNDLLALNSEQLEDVIGQKILFELEDVE